MKKQKDTNDKNELTQNDLKNDVKTFEAQPPMHPALETADGKNNGAKPAAYKNQRSNHP
ncbi:hypothetical protein [Mucilaginibacter sp. HD30]